MPTITYDFIPGQHVFVLEATAPNVIVVKHAKVVQVIITEVMTETAIQYRCQLYPGYATSTVNEVDMFADIDSALLEYKARLEAQTVNF